MDLLVEVVPHLWSLEDGLTGARSYGSKIGGIIISIIGLIIVIYAAFLIFKAITGQQGSGGTWAKAAVALVVGGALLFGGFTLFSTVTKDMNKTVESFGNGGEGTDPFSGVK